MTYPPPAADDGIPPLADIDYATITVQGPTLVMTGEIDTVAMLAWQQEHPTPPVVHIVDATDVTFMNSAGLAYLITLAKGITPARLTVHAAHRGVLRPMQQMGLTALLDIST